jgi:hypothetical protein
MMKRFTETTKWDDPWFMDLPVKYKAFWIFICDRCDCAGVWEPNMRLAVTQIGEPLELVEVLRVFEKRIEQTLEGKLWIRGFIKFQYGIELNPSNTAHLGVLRRLEKSKITSPVPIAPSKGLQRGLQAPKDKDKDKDKKEEVQEKPNLVPTALDIYNAYPRHERRPHALQAIEKAIRKGFGAAFLLERTMAYAKTQPPRSRFTPHPATWFNAEQFNDDPAEWVRLERNTDPNKRPSRQSEAERWYEKKYGTGTD